MAAFVTAEGLTDTKADWMELAACKGVGHAEFFIERGHTIDNVKDKYCKTCPVREECLNYAVVNRISHGVWFKNAKERQYIYSKAPRRDTVSQTLRNRMVWLANHGWRHAEIANELGFTEKTVSHYINRARREAVEQ
jgi:WhiB family redox-sensing transcriptional regulator